MAEARRCGVARALFCRLLLFFFFSPTPSTPSAIRRFHFRMATTAVRRACGQDVWTTSFWGASPLKSCAPTVYYSDRIGSNGEQTCSRSRRWCIVPLPVTRVFLLIFFLSRIADVAALQEFNFSTVCRAPKLSAACFCRT